MKEHLPNIINMSENQFKHFLAMAKFELLPPVKGMKPAPDAWRRQIAFRMEGEK